MTAKEKYVALLAALKGYGQVAVAFSAGVDSSFLLYAAQQALGENVLAVTVHSPFVPAQEQQAAQDFCRTLDVQQLRLTIDTLAIAGVRENPPERCYLCKHALFSEMRRAAAEAGFPAVVEGSNADDLGDYRPGMRALRELGILSPLLDAGLTKQEIRTLSKEAGLPCWDKPAMACLATRFPCGTPLAVEGLRRVEQAEAYLRTLNLHQLRVRAHGDLARIELEQEELSKLLENAAAVTGQLQALGFRYVTLDLHGYQTGSMNPQQVARMAHTE